jgi:hypothetical protein
MEGKLKMIDSSTFALLTAIKASEEFSLHGSDHVAMADAKVRDTGTGYLSVFIRANQKAGPDSWYCADVLESLKVAG